MKAAKAHIMILPSPCKGCAVQFDERFATPALRPGARLVADFAQGQVIRQIPSPPERILDRLLIKTAPVAPTDSADRVFALFKNNPDLYSVPVVSDGAPLGLISRYEMMENMARPYRHELFGRSPCVRFMAPQTLIVDIGLALAELAALIVNADQRQIITGFIITHRGDYLGMGSLQDVVREVTAMQIEAAKCANPLTQLPGNVPIRQHIDTLLAAGEIFCVAYCDLDHFKPFNDVYGYAKGDEVLQMTARVLAEVCDKEQDFTGHIGGDDFVLIFRSPDWLSRCRRALERFGSEIRAFFRPEDIARGGYDTENRNGAMESHPLTALSIGAVMATPGTFRNHLEVSEVAAEAKTQAKKTPGNSIFVNQRRYGAQPAPPAYQLPSRAPALRPDGQSSVQGVTSGQGVRS